MLVDTSVVVELLGRPATHPLVRRIVLALGDEVMFASPVQLGELADAARARGQSVPDTVQKARGLLEWIPLDPDIAVEGSNLKAEARRTKTGRGFSLIDGVLLASARVKGQRLLTLDTQFASFGDATVLAR